jgi:hypothetical protein
MTADEAKQAPWKKVIICGLPMQLRDIENGGAELKGFWSYLYLYIFCPIEALFVTEFKFMEYEGSYWEGLKEWFRDDE